MNACLKRFAANTSFSEDKIMLMIAAAPCRVYGHCMEHHIGFE